MDTATLDRLEKLNQLQLTDTEKSEIISFFARAEKDMEALNAVDTENTLRMVHVMPMENVLREDVSKQDFTRESLQEGAPEATDGCWQVPRLVE